MSKSITETLLRKVTVVSSVHQKYRSEVLLTKLLDKFREQRKVSEQLRQKNGVVLIEIPRHVSRSSVCISKGSSYSSG